MTVKISSRTGSETKISENKVTNRILKPKFSNAIDGLNTLTTTKQAKNDFLKEWFHQN